MNFFDGMPSHIFENRLVLAIFILVFVLLASFGGILVAINQMLGFYLIGLVFFVLVLLTQPILFLYLFVAIMPLEQFNLGIAAGLPRLLGPLALLGWFLDWRKRRYPLRVDSTLKIMLLFLAWGFVSFFWTIDQGSSLRVLITYLLLLPLYFMLVNYIRTDKDLFHILLMLALGGAVLIASGAVSMMTGGFLEYSSPQERLTGLLDNPNKYVISGILTMPAFYYLLKKGKLLSMGAILFMALFVVTSLYTQSRGGLVSLAGFGLVLLLFRSSRGRNWLFVLMGFLLVWQLAPVQLWARFDLIGSETNDRLSVLWPAGFDLVEKNLFLGTGIGTNNISMGKQLGGGAVSVHSAPLAIAIELGLTGLVIYLGFVMLPIKNLWKAIVNRDCLELDMKVFAVFIMAGLLGFLLTWVKGGAMEFNKILWLDLALATASVHLLQASQAGRT
jgi:hypothetical protein